MQYNLTWLPSKLRWLLLYYWILYSFGLLLATGVISQWGQWYSQSLHHRRQVEGLLAGSLAMSAEASALTHDLCWSQGGVHQVWGLGIPLWRLPFESVARMLGAGGFPDFLAVAIALALAAWVVLRALFVGALRGKQGVRTPALLSAMGEGESKWSLSQIISLAGAAGLLLLYPPFVNLLQSRFDIYEEVIAYEYIVGLGLISGLLVVAQRVSVRAYWLMCLVAGLDGFFRPTLVLHGAAAVAAGAAALWWGKGCKDQAQSGKTPAMPDGIGSVRQLAISPDSPAGRPLLQWRRTVAVGAGLFVVGGGLLWFANYARFGSGFEFGHRLNVQYLYGSLYATRFDDPYQDEPLPLAARELFGWLFLSREFNSGNFYQEHIFSGQSSNVRWREVYLTTYDLTYLPWLLAGLVAGIMAWGQRRKVTLTPALSTPMGQADAASTIQPFNRLTLPVGTLALYGVLASSLLLGFYLRNPVISSRYLLDLMPSFAALMLAAWLAWGGFWLARQRGRWVLGLSALLLVFWLGWELSHSGSAYGPPRALTWKEVVSRNNPVACPVALPPSGTYASAASVGETAIPFNGAGWEAPSGRVKPCVILFVDNPGFLELELAAVSEEASTNAPLALRAKVGLEFLKRQSIVKSGNGWVVRFAGPQRRQYQQGIQPVFLATVLKEHLADSQTPWRLLKVRWKEGNK